MIQVNNQSRHFLLRPSFHIPLKSTIKNEVSQMRFYRFVLAKNLSVLKSHYGRDILGRSSPLDIFHLDFASGYPTIFFIVLNPSLRFKYLQHFLTNRVNCKSRAAAVIKNLI